MTLDNARAQELEESLCSVALNLALHFTTAQDGVYPSTYKRIHQIIDRALCPLARQLNESRKVIQLPVEIFASIAALLPLADLYSAALVCHSWRATLLGTPHLWQKICVDQEFCAVSGVDVFRTLLTRSQELPLTVEYRCSLLSGPGSLNSYRRSAKAIMEHMHRVKSLSLTLPVIIDTEFEHLLRTAAPLLEHFRLHHLEQGRDDEATILPADLFLHQAPLRSLSLYRVSLPEDTCPAVRSVTQLFYDPGTIGRQELHNVISLFPSLQSLTIVGVFCAAQEPQHSPLPLRLRVAAISHISSIIDGFPNASSVCMSASWKGAHHNPVYLADILVAAAQRHQPTSVDISWRPCQWDSSSNDDFYSSIGENGGLAISLDGVDVAVDLCPGDVVRAVTAAWSHLTRRLRRLAIPDDLCPFISRMALPALDELTLYFFHPDDRKQLVHQAFLPPELQGRTAVLFSVPTLHIVAPPDGRRCIPDLHEPLFARAISSVVDPRALQTLILSGIGLDSPAGNSDDDDNDSDTGRLHSLAPHLQIVCEPRPATPRWEPWLWKLPEESAMCI